MKRLTYRNEYGEAAIVGVDNNDLYGSCMTGERNSIIEAIERLEQYEDMCIPIVQTSICVRAIKTFGDDAQTDMLIEEMSELTKALLKLRRKQNRRIDYDMQEKNDVAEEIADVIITLVQQLIILDCYDDVDAIVSAKLRRLNSRLEAEAGE